MPHTLICRRHYGFNCGMYFRPGIDDEKDAYVSWGQTYCKGRVQWLMAKVRYRLIAAHFSRPLSLE